MVSCTHCTARFSASPEIEANWAEAHFRRFHDPSRRAARATANAHAPWRLQQADDRPGRREHAVP